MQLKAHLGRNENAVTDTIFLEVVLQAADFEFGGRDEIEDPLEEALASAEIGEVTGGGAGSGVVIVDIEVADLDAGLELLRSVLKNLQVAHSTRIKQYQPDEIVHLVYE
jgi:hypothetical protein